MKRFRSVFVKGCFLLFIVTLLSLVKAEDVKAETFLSGATIEVADANRAADIDWDAIISALGDQQIVDGSRIKVGDAYTLKCEVIIEPISSSISASEASESLYSSSATTSSTNSYTATCNVYIYISGTSTYAATLTHTVTVTNYPNNLIHISSGSLSVSASSPFTGYPYGYTIVNTDGTFSYAYGTVEIYNTYNQLYYYYGATVSVTPGNSPSFGFTQV